MPTTEKQALQHCYCRFTSEVTDQHDQKLLQGYLVDWPLATMASGELKRIGNGVVTTPHCIVENAITTMLGQQNPQPGESAFHTMVLPPVNELMLDLTLADFPPSLRDVWVNKQLLAHMHAKAKEVEEEVKKNSGEDIKVINDVDATDTEGANHPTLLFCDARNLVFTGDSDKMMVNPNIPVPDWFRCANYAFVEKGATIRVLPLLRQASQRDTVYGAVEVTVQEFNRWKELHQYGVSIKHDEAQLWNMSCNFAKEVLRADPHRPVRDIVMFKDRTLTGVLITGAKMRDLLELTQRLNIKLV